MGYFKLRFQHLLLNIAVFLVLLSSFQVASGANVLFFVGIGSYSHVVAILPLAIKLAEIGHNVTFLTPHKPKESVPKIKLFCPQGLLDFQEQFHKDFSIDPVSIKIQDKYSNAFLRNSGAAVGHVSILGHEATLKSPDFHEWLENSTFDLVVTEHPFKEIALIIAHVKKAKVIGFSPTPILPTEPDIFGWPTESSWLPDMTLGSRYQFIPDRFAYEINNILWHLQYTGSYLPELTALANKYLKDIPNIEHLVKNVNLLLVNTHFSNEFARSLPPFVVPIGGMHLKETWNPLPKDLEDFISSGTEGFVYISFGSIIQISALPEKKRKSLFDVLGTFKNARFLIKWDGEVPEDMPINALPMKWFPQEDILAHSMCRGFVSQGGLMSFQQAAYFGVPVIIMPVFVDQPFNAITAAQQGMGIYLELADLTFDTFSDAIRRLLYSDNLSLKAKEVSRRFKDRPMSPVDTAVWWTEYVLRHNDTSHMKPLGIHQAWWQRRLLDFWALVFTGVALIGSIVFLGVCTLLRACLKSIKNPDQKVKRA